MALTDVMNRNLAKSDLHNFFVEVYCDANKIPEDPWGKKKKITNC